MTNEEWIRTTSTRQLVSFLCELTDCDLCEVRWKCRIGKPGYIEWLDKESDRG